MRLIDADVLKKLRNNYIQGRIKFNGDEYDLIDKCPSIDAVPVVHGRWKGEGMGDYSCSLCLEVVSCNFYNYCPNCGAKMI